MNLEHSFRDWVSLPPLLSRGRALPRLLENTALWRARCLLQWAAHPWQIATSLWHRASRSALPQLQPASLMTGSPRRLAQWATLQVLWQELWEP